MSSTSNNVTDQLDILIREDRLDEAIELLEKANQNGSLSDLQKLLFGVLLFSTGSGDFEFTHNVLKGSLNSSLSLDAAVWMVYHHTTLYPIDPCFVDILRSHPESSIAQYMLGYYESYCDRYSPEYFIKAELLGGQIPVSDGVPSINAPEEKKLEALRNIERKVVIKDAEKQPPPLNHIEKYQQLWEEYIMKTRMTSDNWERLRKKHIERIGAMS